MAEILCALWAICMTFAYVISRCDTDKKKKLIEEMTVRAVFYEERIHLLMIKLSASEEKLEEVKQKSVLEKHPEFDITNWSFEYWCQMQGMTEQEIQKLSDDERFDLVLEWKDNILSWGG